MHVLVQHKCTTACSQQYVYCNWVVSDSAMAEKNLTKILVVHLLTKHTFTLIINVFLAIAIRISCFLWANFFKKADVSSLICAKYSKDYKQDYHLYCHIVNHYTTLLFDNHIICSAETWHLKADLFSNWIEWSIETVKKYLFAGLSSA